MNPDHDLPALLGGKPVRPEAPPAWPAADTDVLNALHAAYANGSWGAYLGPNVPQFEQQLAEFHGVSHAVTCASGTLAVEVALRAIGVGPGDEVIIAAYDFEPSFIAIHCTGAQPALAEMQAMNLCLDPTALETAIGPTTKAILVSHLHGSITPMSAIMAMARARGVAVVEDACQATGATVEGRPAGSWGDLGVLSFGGSKLLTAGRGGAILTSRPDLFQRTRVALHRGIQQWAALSELQAAVLIPQLRKLPEMTELRHRRVNQLLGAIRDVPGLRASVPPQPDSRPAYYKLGFFLDEAAFGLSRDLFVKALRAEGIAFDPGFRPLHIGRAPGRYRAVGPLVHAESAGRTVVCLHHPVLALGATEIEQVATAVWKTYRNADRFH